MRGYLALVAFQWVGNIFRECDSNLFKQDFRSSDGLYALVKERYPDVVLKGRDLFDASLFRDPTSTTVFYTFIAQLKRAIDVATPTPTHRFIKTLDDKKKLLRSYTQNIDGFETQVGLLGTACQEAKSSGKGKSKLRTKDVRNVQLHGDIHRVRCTTCSAEYVCSEEHLSFFEKGIAPDCPECLSRCMDKILFSLACFLTISDWFSGGSYRSVRPPDPRWLFTACHCSLWWNSSSGWWNWLHTLGGSNKETGPANNNGHLS